MTNLAPPTGKQSSPVLVAAIVIGIALCGWATRQHWLPLAGSQSRASSKDEHEHNHGHAHAHDDEDDHDHDHPGHSEATAIELSPNGLKNIGYKPVTIALSAYDRTLALPAIVVEKPGRTQIHLTAPLTGIVTSIHAVSGEGVEPGSPMFEMRLTHEELVNAQREFLQSAESLDVIDREISRLKSLGDGVVAGRRVVEQEYEKQKLEATLRADEQALLLHGLNEEQVKQIRETRQLLRSLTVSAPRHVDFGDGCKGEHLYHVQKLAVSQGQHAQAGQELCILADHCELFLEGRAFEDDANVLRKAFAEGWPVLATLLVGGGEKEQIDGLKLLYLADQIEPDSRAFHFYLRLPNTVLLDKNDVPGHRYIEWRYKPGQRMELRVPVERWTDRIVLPIEAIVEEGAEIYVYRQSGDHFDRVPVHVEYRDRDAAVIANDGALAPNDVVAGAGAYQIHLALKNKSGGGIDPHAGHNH